MDTRKYKQSSTSINSIPKEYNDQIIADEDSILKFDQVKNDYQYLDATIFNLCEKIAIGNRLQELYYQNQQQQLNKSKMPKWIKFYIHNPIIVPIFCGSLLIMKWRKTLTLNKSVLALCGISLINEFFKYQNSLRMDDKLAIQYKEHTAAYDDLFQTLVQTMTFSDVARHIFNVDLQKEKLQSESQYDDYLIEDFAMNNY